MDDSEWLARLLSCNGSGRAGQTDDGEWFGKHDCLMASPGKLDGYNKHVESSLEKGVLLNGERRSIQEDIKVLIISRLIDRLIDLILD